MIHEQTSILVSAFDHLNFAESARNQNLTFWTSTALEVWWDFQKTCNDLLEGMDSCSAGATSGKTQQTRDS